MTNCLNAGVPANFFIENPAVSSGNSGSSAIGALEYDALQIELRGAWPTA